LQFSPRRRDTADQQLYRADRRVRYDHIEPSFSGTIKRDLILGRSDDLVRLAALLKIGWMAREACLPSWLPEVDARLATTPFRGIWFPFPGYRPAH
jgi:TnpA family transposase